MKLESDFPLPFVLRGSSICETFRRILAVLVAAAFTGCATTSPQGPAGDTAKLVPVDSSLGRIAADDGSYFFPISSPALRGPGSALGHEEADLSLVFPDQGIGLVVYVHSDTQLSIDDIVHNRRRGVESVGVLDFDAEDRFFLNSGIYRAASLSRFATESNGEMQVAYSLVADCVAGTIEVLGWTYEGGQDESLRSIVSSLQLESEE